MIKCMTGVIAFAIAAAAVAATSPASNPVHVGAIRWDAWYGQAVAGYQACEDLIPKEYEFRAPWFAFKAGLEGTKCDSNNESTIDAEIGYARKAGISYWAFVWYKPDSAMLNGWALYQKSRHKTEVNWTIIAGYGQFHLDMTQAHGYSSPDKYADFFTESNFEKTPEGRPLLYLFSDAETHIDVLARDVTLLRVAASKAHTGNPYVVVMSASPDRAATDATLLGADAISAYAVPAEIGAAPYSKLTEDTQNFWRAEAATGKSVIPIAMTGWDPRPRIDKPVPWQPKRVGAATTRNYFDSATSDEIASQLVSMLAWIRKNRTVVPTNLALIYAWNEFDEGGWICPTWTAHGPDTSRVDALSKILR